jgi:hypothetical protein
MRTWSIIAYTGQVNTAEEVVSLLRSVRPSIVIRPEVMAVLADFARVVNAVPDEAASAVCRDEIVEAYP